MAYHLLGKTTVWLALARTAREEEAVEQLRPQLDTILQFVDGLHARLAASGVDGVEGALSLYHRLKAAVEMIDTRDVTRMEKDVETMQRSLQDLAHKLADIRRLKEQLGD